MNDKRKRWGGLLGTITRLKRKKPTKIKLTKGQIRNKILRSLGK